MRRLRTRDSGLSPGGPAHKERPARRLNAPDDHEETARNLGRSSSAQALTAVLSGDVAEAYELIGTGDKDVAKLIMFVDMDDAELGGRLQ
jgi:hypothetical protein